MSLQWSKRKNGRKWGHSNSRGLYNCMAWLLLILINWKTTRQVLAETRHTLIYLLKGLKQGSQVRLYFVKEREDGVWSPVTKMVHWCNGHEFGQTLGDGEGQGGLVCCSPWVTKSRTWLGGWTTATTKVLVLSSSQILDISYFESRANGIFWWWNQISGLR